jgi:hypothetical protein
MSATVAEPKITTSLFWMERSQSPDMYARPFLNGDLTCHYNVSECRMIDTLVNSEAGTFLVRYMGRTTQTAERYLCDVYEVSERKGAGSRYTVVQHIVYDFMHTNRFTVKSDDNYDLYADSWTSVLEKLGLRVAQCHRAPIEK